MFSRFAQRLTSLFSYDADDNTGSNNNAAPAAPAAPAVGQPSLADTSMKTHDAPGYGEEPEVAFDPISFDTEPQIQSEPVNGNQHDFQVHDAPGVQPPQERFNVNMKEDG